MPNPPLGISTWSLNHLLSPELYRVIDAGSPCPQEYRQCVFAYFNEISDLVLASEETTVELWPSAVLEERQARDGLSPLVEAGRVHSMHAPFRDLSSLDEDDRRESVEACARAGRLLSEYGGKVLVAHGSMPFNDEAEKPGRIRRSAQSIRELSDLLRDAGIRVAVETLPGLTIGSSAPEMLALLEMIDRADVGVCVDVNHIFPKEDLIPAVRMIGPRLLSLHISDYDGVEERHWLPMDGVIAWPALVRALREVDYDGPFMYEVHFTATTVAEGFAIIHRNYETIMASE